MPLDATDPMYEQVRVLVMNNSPGNHSVFDKVRTLYHCCFAGTNAVQVPSPA